EVFDDGRLATFSLHWPILRLYSGDIMSEHEVDLAILATEGPAEFQQDYQDLMDEFRSHPPERITRIAASRDVTREDFAQVSLLIRMRCIGRDLWAWNAGVLFRLNETGEITRIIKAGEFGIPWEFTIHENRVAFCYSSGDLAGIGIGRLPD
ncbi:hypothetical protein ACFL41_02090, partial [Gemmatimonadota bacterium]